MKTLYKFILKTYAGPMIMAFALVLFVFIMQFLWLHLDDIAGKGLTIGTLLQFLGWMSITFIELSIPMASLFASLIVMGNMGQSNELLALKASGISLHRVYYPLYVTVFLLAVTAFCVTSYVAPHAFLRVNTMLQDIKNTKEEISIPVGIFYDEIDNMSIHVKGKDNKTGVLKNVMIYDHSKRGGNLSLTLADSGYILQSEGDGNMLIKLIDGKTYEEDPLQSTMARNRNEEAKLGFSVRSFKQQSAIVNLAESSGTSEDLFKDVAGAQSIKNLTVLEDSVSKLRESSLSNFYQEYMLSNNTFRGFKSFSEEFDEGLIYTVDYDSIFNTLTAQEKLDVLDRAVDNSNRASDNWKISMLELEKYNKQVRQYNLSWHKKFSISLTCIIFFFIGAPLGSIINKGGLGWPMIISILFFIIFLVTDSTSKRMVLSNGWDSRLGAWLPFAIFVPIAVFLTYKSNTDSELFNPESYARFFNKLFGRTHKLIEPINLDDLKVLSVEEQKEINYVQEISNLKIDLENYFNDLSLNNTLLSSSNITSFDDLERLEELKNKYEKVILHLVGIYNETIRSDLKEMPLISVDEYRYKSIVPESFKNNIVGRLIISIQTFRKRKKLMHIINRILEKNNRISQIIIKNVSN